MNSNSDSDLKKSSLESSCKDSVADGDRDRTEAIADNPNTPDSDCRGNREKSSQPELKIIGLISEKERLIKVQRYLGTESLPDHFYLPTYFWCLLKFEFILPTLN